MEPKDKRKDSDPNEKAEQNKQRRKLIQFQNDQEYLQALVTIKQK